MLENIDLTKTDFISEINNGKFLGEIFSNYEYYVFKNPIENDESIKKGDKEYHKKRTTSAKVQGNEIATATVYFYGDENEWNSIKDRRMLEIVKDNNNKIKCTVQKQPGTGNNTIKREVSCIINNYAEIYFEETIFIKMLFTNNEQLTEDEFKSLYDPLKELIENKNLKNKEYAFEIVHSLLNYVLGKNTTYDVESIVNNFSLNIKRELEDIKTILEESNISALGIHFIDKEFGRHSRIWLSQKWEKENKHEIKESILSTYWSLYTHIWMRLYWKSFGTTTTLINAFQENILPWEGSRSKYLYFHWEENIEKNQLIDPRIKNVYIGDFEYIRKFREISKYLEKNIHLELANHIDIIENISENKEDEQQILEQLYLSIELKMKKAQILDEYNEACIIQRKKILSDQGEKNKLTDVLNQLCDSAKMIHKELSYKVGERNQENYLDVLKQIEALFSSVANEYSFCSANGILLSEILKEKDIKSFLVIGFSDNKINDNMKKIISFFENFLSYIYNKSLKNKSIESPESINNSSDQLVTKVYEILSKNMDSNYSNDIYHWIKFIISLSEKAVHEKKESSFNVGWGAGYLIQTKCDMYEKVPHHFVNEKDITKLVQFIRSYFPLFGQEDKICWFNVRSHLQGIYSMPIGGNIKTWLYKWNNIDEDNYYIAKILGLRKIDIYNAKGQRIARIRQNSVEENNNQSSSVQTTKHIKNLFSSILKKRSTEFGEKLSTLFNYLKSNYKELGLGTSLVFVRSDHSDNWSEKYKNANKKILFKSQIKKLAMPLDKYSSPLISMKDFLEATGDRIEILAKDISRLAHLDGATIIYIDEKGLTVQTTTQIIPIIKNDENDILPFDIMSLSDSEISEDELEDENRWTNNDIKIVSHLLSGKRKARDENEKKLVNDLSFLNSAGTKHHSLWGITLTAKEPLLALVISDDGDMRTFSDGRLIDKII